MITYLNGCFLPEERASVSVHDRGFLYGDGIFETIPAYGGKLFLWREHMVRLEHGSSITGIALPLSRGEMERVVNELLRRNAIKDALIRITVSRGCGTRGYSPRGAESPTFCITVHPRIARTSTAFRVITSRFRLPQEDDLAAIKHANKLRQVLARAEADEAGADEALMLNEADEVVEGTSTNVFWVEKETVCTPPTAGILSGTTRAHVLNLCGRLKFRVKEKAAPVKALLKVDGVFLTSSAIEIVPVSEINGVRIAQSKLISKLKQIYRTHS